MKRWPPLSDPALNCGFVALSGATYGLLGTPARGAQQPADMIGMVADVEFVPNDCRDALGGPDLTEEPKGFGAPGEQIGELCELLGAQSGRGAGCWLVV